MSNGQFQDGSTRRDYRGFFPGMFTMGNLVCGFIAVISISEGAVVDGCWFIILAAFLDLLDGKVARLAGANSRFGTELDSLADFMSFGVAPAFLVYTIKLGDMGKWGWIICVVYIMAASYRLARYNLLAQSDEKKNFLGMPVPVAALAIVTFVIFSYTVWESLQYSEYLVTMIISFAALMVSQVEFEAIPDRPRGTDKLKFIMIFVAITGLLVNAQLFLFPIIALYILYSVGREIYRLFHKGFGLVRNRNSEQDGQDGRDEQDY